ncbi:MAG: tetraacyldisaccharide 4'-kinase [Planctomycetota bacterium]
MDLTLPQRLQQSVQGSFHKTALLQQRVRELIRGAALVESRETNPIKIAFLEMERGLIELIPDDETIGGPPMSRPDRSGSVRVDQRRMEHTLARRGGWVELLRLPAGLAAGAAGLRRRLYDRGVLRSHAAGVPVLSVGNIAVGGTGKTPFVVSLVEWLALRGLRPAVLSRGYGRAAGAQLNDEGLMLAARFPDLLQEQDADRVAGARRLVARGAQVIVLDDGFQHRRLQRDWDGVLIDASRPFGLPAPPDGGAPVAAHLPRGSCAKGPRRWRGRVS